MTIWGFNVSGLRVFGLSGCGFRAGLGFKVKG